MERPGATITPIPVSTTFDLAGRQIKEVIGSCFGVVVRSMGFGRQIGAGFKALRQGEVSQYTELLEDSRRHALDRLVENAQLLGGDAIVGMRFDSSEIGQNLTEIVAYGTAVRLA
ncbi:MAG TPA: YbjQ family protein [Acidimicrobiales bacterium]|nr:YbjQ family protein [Acidimicrobiales bacterium]